MIIGVNHITLAVTDVDRSFAFYREVLGFAPLCKWPGGAYFLVGELWLCLSKDPMRGPKPAPDYTHIAFSVSVTDFSEAVERLKEAKVLQFKENVSEGDSFYFIDPDGHKLELHVGDWKTRMLAKKQNPCPDTEFFATHLSP